MADYDIDEIEKYCHRLYFYDSVDSTNKAALEQENAPDRSVFLTEKQMSGRGRMGRTWDSSADAVAMTILLRPTGALQNYSALTLVCGLAISRIIENSKIKWPNDIILNDKKVSGILVESRLYPNGKDSIAIGIGINVNTTKFSDELKEKATSMLLENKQKYDKTEIVTSALKEFWELYEKFEKHGFSSIEKEYKKRSATIGREIVVVKNNEKLFGEAIDITHSGELIAEISGKREVLNSGEVSVRGLLGYN